MFCAPILYSQHTSWESSLRLVHEECFPPPQTGASILTELSPFLGAEGFRGKRMSLDRYSFSRCTFACNASVDLLRRLGSTEMPIVRAYFLLMPAIWEESDHMNNKQRRLLHHHHPFAGCRARTVVSWKSFQIRVITETAEIPETVRLFAATLSGGLQKAKQKQAVVGFQCTGPLFNYQCNLSTCEHKVRPFPSQPNTTFSGKWKVSTGSFLAQLIDIAKD